MAIVTDHDPVASARAFLVGDLGNMINEAIKSSDKITPWALADNLLEAVERSIRMVDDDGAVVYHD